MFEIWLSAALLLVISSPIGLLESMRQDRGLRYFVLACLLFGCGFALLFAHLVNTYH